MISNPRRPVSQPTFSPAAIVADTIVRTVELGVVITDAVIDGVTTVVWCDLRASGPDRCPGCGRVGIYRDRVERDRPAGGRVTVGEHEGCSIELLQRETIDTGTGRTVQREPPRIIVTCNGSEELNLHAEKAEVVGIAIARAAVLSRRDGY